MSSNWGRAMQPDERLTKHVQTKLTPSDKQRLLDIRDELLAKGLPVTESSLMRAFINRGIRNFREEIERGQAQE